MAEQKKNKRTTLWFYMDLTTIVTVLVLAAGVYWGKGQYDQYMQREAQAKAEKEAKEKESRAKEEEKEKQRLAEQQEREKARRAAEEQARKDEEAKQRAALEAKQRAALEAKQAAEKEKKEPQEEAKTKLDAKKKEDAETPENQVAEWQRIWADANKELPKLRARVDDLQRKLVAFKSNAAYALKKHAGPRDLIDILSTIQPPPIKSTGGARTKDIVEQTMKKISVGGRGFPKDCSDAASGWLSAKADQDEAVRALSKTEQSRDEAAAKLKSMGLELAAGPDAAPGKPGEAPAPPKKVFVMKDGRKIIALQVVDGGDLWSIKIEGGDIKVIDKDSVEKIEDLR